MKTGCMIAIAIALAAAPTPTVRAQSADAAPTYDEHLDAGLAHYEARRYAEAARSFRAAFDLRPEPDLMYNVARSLERSLEREDAIAAYDQFLTLSGTTSEMRARARDARDSLRRELNAMNAPDPVVPDPVDDPEPVDTGATGEVQHPDPPLPEEPSSPLRPVGWSLLGVGAAAAIAGGVFGGLALSANSDFDDATDRDEQVRLRDDVNQYALLADVLVGGGVALAVVGIVLVVLGKSDLDETNTQASLEIAPVVGAQELGLTLRGAF